MADLIERTCLVVAQLAVGAERLLLEEKADFVARIEEILVAGLFLLGGRKDRILPGWLEFRHQLRRPRQDGVACRRVGKILQHEEAVTAKIDELLRVQHESALWVAYVGSDPLGKGKMPCD